MTNKEISYEICCIAESLNCLWVIDSHIDKLKDVVNKLMYYDTETIDKLSQTFDTYLIRLNHYLTGVLVFEDIEDLTIHPDEKGEWSILKSNILNDLDKLISKLQ